MSALLACLAVAAQQPTPITISVKPNDRFSYRVTTTIDGGEKGGRVTFAGEFAERVLKVTPKEIVFNFYCSRVDVSGTGPLGELKDHFKELEGVQFVQHRDHGNELRKLAMGGIELQKEAVSSTSDCTWPIKPLSPGEKWVTKRVLTNIPAPIYVDSTFMGVVEKNGVPCFEIKSVVRSLPSLEALEPQMTWVERSTGRAWYGHGKFKTTQNGAQVTMSYILERTATRLSK